jgi:hypothetical protein
MTGNPLEKGQKQESNIKMDTEKEGNEWSRFTIIFNRGLLFKVVKTCYTEKKT